VIWREATNPNQGKGIREKGKGNAAAALKRNGYIMYYDAGAVMC
jgi:hypothetical protein